MSKVESEANEKRKYIWESVYAMCVFLLLTVLPALVGDIYERLFELPDDTYHFSHTLYTISTLLWLVFPAAIIIILALNHKIYGKMQAAIGNGSLRLMWSLAIAIYLVYSNKNAGDLVNNLFKVDSGHFGISVATFSIFYAPLEFYRTDTVKTFVELYAPAKNWLFGLALLIGCFVLFKAIKDKDKNEYKNKNKKAVASIIFVLFTIWAHNAVAFVPNMSIFLKNFIVWADFNDNHRCGDPWLQRGKSVVFLDGSNVLAIIEPAVYVPFGKVQLLMAGPCTYPSRKEIESSFK